MAKCPIKMREEDLISPVAQIAFWHFCCRVSNGGCGDRGLSTDSRLKECRAEWQNIGAVAACAFRKEHDGDVSEQQLFDMPGGVRRLGTPRAINENSPSAGSELSEQWPGANVLFRDEDDGAEGTIKQDIHVAEVVGHNQPVSR